MKLSVLAAVLAVFGVAACARAAVEPQLTQEQLVARGAYLVNGLVGCNDCHTPMTPAGPDATRALQGSELAFAPTIEIPWGAYAPPLAGGPGNYTDEQFIAFLQTGARPDGSHARPPMPQFRMNEDDARAVAAYINTLPPAAPPQE